MVTLAFDEYGLSITDLHAIWGEHIYGIESGKKVFPSFPGMSGPSPSLRGVYSQVNVGLLLFIFFSRCSSQVVCFVILIFITFF